VIYFFQIVIKTEHSQKLAKRGVRVWILENFLLVTRLSVNEWNAQSEEIKSSLFSGFKRNWIITIAHNYTTMPT